jgi:CRISPR/Cas system-associated exonuclease Cas4 (RecB family)
MNKLDVLGNDIGKIASILEKYVKEIVEIKARVTELEREKLQMQVVINEQAIRLDALEHNVNNEIYLHEWMRDESVKNAIDFTLTPKEISRGKKNYDDAVLRFRRN